MANRVMIASMHPGGETLANDFHRLIDERNCMLRMLQLIVEHASPICQECRSSRREVECPWTELRSFVAELKRAA